MFRSGTGFSHENDYFAEAQVFLQAGTELAMLREKTH
jgi:hypothetical protein